MNKFKLNLKPGIIIAIGIIVYSLILSLVCFWKYYNYGYNVIDLAIINQVFYNTIHGHIFASSIHPPTYLADHFTPIIFFILPFYFIFASPIFLLVLQSIVLGACAWPIYLIVKNILNQKWALGFAIAWLVNPLIANINLFEWHFLPIAIFLLFWTIYFYQKNNFKYFLLFCGLSMLVREDVFLVIIFFSLLAMFDKKSLKWIISPLALAISYALIAFSINIFFAQNHQYKFFIYYSWLGKDWINLVFNALLNPLKVIVHVLKLKNFEFFIGLLLPFGFLPIIKPKYLILIFGVCAQQLLNTNGLSATVLYTHYTSLFLPSLLVASAMAIAKIVNSKKPVFVFLKNNYQLTNILIVFTVIYSALALGPTIGIIKQFKTNGLIWPETPAKNQLILSIPTDAAVAATYNLLPALSNRQSLYSLNYVFLNKQQFLFSDYTLPKNTEYLAIDFSDLIAYKLQYNQNPYYKNQYNFAINNWQKNLDGFGLLSINDTLALYKKNQPDQVELVKIFDHQPTITNLVNININNEIIFLGWQQIQNQFQFFWQAKKPNTKNYQIKITASANGQEIFSKIYPLAYDLIPNSQWRTDQVIQTNYWLNWLDSKSTELKIQLININSGGLELNQIGSSENIFDQITNIGESISLFD